MFNMFSIICMPPRLCKYPFDILKKVMEFFWFSEFFTTFFMLFSCFTVTFPAFSQKKQPVRGVMFSPGRRIAYAIKSGNHPGSVCGTVTMAHHIVCGKYVKNNSRPYIQAVR